jgi:hypothetical protein
MIGRGDRIGEHHGTCLAELVRGPGTRRRSLARRRRKLALRVCPTCLWRAQHGRPRRAVQPGLRR